MEPSWNEEIYEDLGSPDYSQVRVYSRDWTVETILSQIKQGNIDLNPQFQRRNAWNDIKRSRLVESILLGVPIPEIILAEDPHKKGAFIVIDGKQRLLTLHGYTDPTIPYWTNSVLTKIRHFGDLDLTGVSYKVLESSFPDYFRAFCNRDIRCTVISNFSGTDVLYDIFYRLNTGSVPLSTQELRLALYRGGFSDELVKITDKVLPLHAVISGRRQPDPRLRDAELLLRLVSIEAFAELYQGNLKAFLDQCIAEFNFQWGHRQKEIKEIMVKVLTGVDRLAETLTIQYAGRKYKHGRWEGRFNKAIFEAQAFYFARVPDAAITAITKTDFQAGFKDLCESNKEFLSAVESSTKTQYSYSIRYAAIRDLVNSVFGLKINAVPIA